MNYPTFNQYIHLTNLGAHFSTASSQVNAERAALQLLLNNAITPKLKDYLAALKTDSDIPAFQQVIALFNQGYITAADFPTELKGQSFELNLAKRLAQLSDTQHSLLCDQEGFLIAYAGFDIDQAEQAAVLAIEISGLQAKRQHNINEFSGTHASSISIADEEGNTQMRFLPIHFKQQIFILAIQGQAQIQQDSFTQLIWLLSQRYS
ncbi:MAG: roadblock/LC7 domain-containing protein [Oleispira sp.]|jgi:hypothetical protein